jgi:RNA polymerase sigma-70 factor (ECF subfamily)
LEERDSESLLVKRAIQGDSEAIGEIYRRYAPAIFRYLFYRVGDKETAEDLTSEVFLRALKAFPRYQQRGLPFSAWLYRIAGARVADYFRRRRRRSTVPLRAEISAGAQNPEQELESRLEVEELQFALAQLPQAHQQVIVLRFVERLPHAEVAQIMNRSKGAIRVLQYRALAKLRKILEEAENRDIDPPSQ